MRIVRPFLLAMILVLAVASGLAAQQGTIAGQVTSEGQAVATAQVVITNEVTGAQEGAITGNDGRFSVQVRPGTYKVEARIIGYTPGVENDVAVRGGESVSVNFPLMLEAVTLAGLEVTASRAVERRTPVAFSEISQVEIQNQLGSRDLPLVLNTEPSVYSTGEGGGAGDARINVRGFSQRNTAVMVNGVPVNDMENGWVYWSNWDGLGDVAQNVQLQRGLSAVNLATPSIGGTLNIMTVPSEMQPEISLKQEAGSGDMLKTTLTGSTGLLGRFAFTGNLVRETADGIADGLWTDSWAYYAASSFDINQDNRLELFAVGAPQRHGQRLYALNAATWDREFALGLDSYDPAALDKFSEEAGLDYNPNYGEVSPSYGGMQYASSGPETGTFGRYSSTFLNERENYFHKPQVNLNWYSYLGSGMSLSTIGYYSGGRGGGSGTLGSLVWDYTYTQRFANWDATIARNAANGPSRGIIRNSVNNQDTWGAISKLRKEFATGLNAEVGIDLRTAKIQHYREVRDLLGGDYWLDDANEFAGARQTVLGDVIDYSNENTVNWGGAHFQLERSSDAGSLYGMTGVSAISYDYEDFFRRDPASSSETLKLNSGTLTGFQVKGGAMRNLNLEWSVFGNAGYVSKVPIFDGVIDDFNGVKNPDPQNETFLSFEAGMQYRSLNRLWSLDANVYHTTWNNRTYNVFVRNLLGTNQDGLVNLLGLDARHMGVEASGAFQPSDLIRFDVATSIGDWKYLNDVTGTYRDDEGAGTSTTYDFYLNGIYVGDAPQIQASYAVSLFPIQGLYLQGVGKSYGKHYADFDPFDRTDPDESGIQSWKAPGYTVFDLHASYTLTDLIPGPRRGDIKIFANVFNLLDSRYVSDATDNSSFNGFDGDHDADDAELFLGLERNFDIGLQLTY